MMRSWSVGERISCLSLFVTVLGTIAAWLVVPGVRERMSSIGNAREQTFAAPSTLDGGSDTDLSPSSADTVATSDVQPATAPQTVTRGVYSVTLDRCANTGAGVMCYGWIVNNTSDERRPRLATSKGGSSSTLVDENGIPHAALQCWLGGDSGYSWASERLEPGVRYLLNVKFDRRAIPIKRGQFVDLYIWDDVADTDPRRCRTFRFQNIVVQFDS